MIESFLAASGHTKAQLADAARVPRTTVYSICKGYTQSARMPTFQKLLLGMESLAPQHAPEMSTFFDAVQDEVPNMTRQLTVPPVVGIVEAGVWREADEAGALPRQEQVMADQRFAHMEKVVFYVACMCCDKLVAQDSAVMCARFDDLVKNQGRWPQTGDLVVVFRRRENLIEATLRQVVLKREAIELWPRSTDPRYQKPWVKPRGKKPALVYDDIEIRYLAFAKYEKFPT